jgi:hypothetical protein
LLSVGQNAAAQESNEKGLAIREFMLNSISHGVMMCKLNRINEESDQFLSMRGLSSRFSKDKINSSVEMGLNDRKDKKYSSKSFRQKLHRKIKMVPV